MVNLVNNFYDVIYLDATHKSNRFNLPLLDGAIINNLGQTSSCFWSLLSNHKHESYYWAMYHFKKSINVVPKVFFVEKEEALIQGNSL